jgi:hypothetical protein
MGEGDRLAERFEEHRTRLTAVAYRMLGSPSEADDVVQEAWLRFNRSDTSAVENLGSWLTTVVSRLCLNVLQARRSRPEVPLDLDALDEEPMVSPDSGTDPEEEMMLADYRGDAGRTSPPPASGPSVATPAAAAVAAAGRAWEAVDGQVRPSAWRRVLVGTRTAPWCSDMYDSL